MSFAGHALDMINRIKYNESLKKGIRSRYHFVKKAYEKKLNSAKYRAIKNIDVSDTDLKALKSQIRKEIAYERRKDIFLSLFIMAISVVVSILILFVLVKVFMVFCELKMPPKA